ncbi:MAG TPA: hypothetical protein VIG06_20920 [Kofleriaceae bacterium]
MASREFDVLIATDFRHSGGTTASIAQEVEVQARMGLRTGLVQIEAPYLAARPWSARIRALVGAGLAEVVNPRRAARARLLVLRHPRVFAADGWKIAARGDHTLMIANQVPQDGALARPYYDVPTVEERLAAELGGVPEWAPIGPMVRESLLRLPRAPALTAQDWHNIIDVDSWARPRHPRGGTPVIGRHARDDIKKWPESPEDLLAAYPDTGEPRVRVLGGNRAAFKILGRYPWSWEVYPFGSVPPEDFLAGLDAYVYFTHSGLREAFGRAVLEALAAGLPVVTQPYLERLFEDACVYAEPKDAGRIAVELARDRPAPNRRGLELVRERYDWDAHRRRLDPYLGHKLPAVKRAPAPRKRVLFVTSNGGGMGHLTRALAIARRMPADHEPLFLTMSTGIEAVRKEGFWVDFMPSMHDSDLTSPRFLEYFRARLVSAIRTLHPRALVFDGTFAYSPLVLALSEFPELFKVWSRRGMWKAVSPQRHAQSMAQMVAFDLVLEPGELAAEVDSGVTRAQQGAVGVIDPIVYLDKGELLSREEARRELGVPPDAVSGLVNLGAGNINRLDNVYEAIAAMLGRHRDVHLVGVQSLISERGIPIDPARLHPIETYPLSRMLRAFDFCIAAPGYNSFHELLCHAVPTLFIPNEETALDDQGARAEWAERKGMALVGRESDGAQLEAAVTHLMDPAVRDGLAARCRELPEMDGAREAAGIIAAGRPPGQTVTSNGAPRRPPPPGRSPYHPIEIIRVTRRYIRRTREALQPPSDRAIRALRTRAGDVLPWSWVPPPPAPPPVVDAGPPAKVLLVADRELPSDASVEELVDWASAHRGGAIILAGSRAVQRLRRAGLAVELITEVAHEEIGERLELTAYWNEKARLMLATYNVGPVIFWGDSELKRHWPVLLLLDR